MGWWHHGMGIGGWASLIIGGLMMLLVWGGLFALIFFAVRLGTASRRTSESSDPEDGARQILAERYARGEIASETFREMKRELQR